MAHFYEILLGYISKSLIQMVHLRVKCEMCFLRFYSKAWHCSSGPILGKKKKSLEIKRTKTI